VGVLARLYVSLKSKLRATQVGGYDLDGSACQIVCEVKAIPSWGIWFAGECYANCM